MNEIVLLLLGVILGEIAPDIRSWLVPRIRLFFAKLSQPKSQRVLRLYKVELEELHKLHADPWHFLIKGTFRVVIYLIAAFLTITFCIIGNIQLNVNTNNIPLLDGLALTISAYAAVVLVTLALLKCLDVYGSYKKATEQFADTERKLESKIADVEQHLLAQT